jgi:peptidoglycan/LPS O-acetylase OafA/YrhL
VAGLADLRTTREFLHRFIGRRAVRVVVVVLLVVVVVILLFLVLNWYIAPTKPSQRKDLVLAVAQILGGTALLSCLYFTWSTLQVNREGRITERFTRAIDQLGATDDDAKSYSRYV